MSARARAAARIRGILPRRTALPVAYIAIVAGLALVVDRSPWQAFAAFVALSAGAIIAWRVGERGRHGAHESLSTSEELFRGVFEAAATGMVVASLDGRVVRANAAYCELTGYREEELVGRRFSDFTHPDDRQVDSGALERLIAGDVDTLHHRKRYVRPQGETIWAELHSSMVKDRHGAPLYMVAQVGDVTARKRGEDALRSSEERYRTLVSHLPDTVVSIYDRDFRTTYMGGSMFDKLGWRAEDFIGRTIHESLPPEMADSFAARFRAAMAGMPNEMTHTTESGLELEIKIIAIQDDQGEAAGVMSVCRDVSDSRRADEVLRETQDRLQAILDYAPAVIYLKDAAGRFVLANHGLQDLLGVPFEQIRGRTDADFFPPEVAAELAVQDREVRESQRPLARETEIVVSGEPRTFFDIKFPIFDSGGEVTGVCAIATDITARKRAEVALRVSEQRHRSVVDALEEGVLLHDMSGTVIACNQSAAEMVGLPIEEIVGKTPQELPMRLVREDGTEFPDDDRPGYRAFVTGEPQLGIIAGHPHANGDMHWLSINCNPILDPQTGDAFAVAASFADITEARRAESLKEEFFALVSHELRTPLTSITGYLELVMDPDESELDPIQHKFLGVVERNAKRLQRLVGDLLFVAQFEAGKLSLDTGPTAIEDVAAESVESARPRADELSIDLRLNAETTPLYHGDAGRLGQTLDNLISNALKFTPSGGRVDVRVLHRRDRVVMEVADTGLGISVPDQRRLFERFFRTTAATEAAIPGVGLGLSISKAIVEGHGGTITVASDEGHGTTFTIELPFVAAPAPRPRPRAIDRAA
jgi:PAS domain S-box-containing protein